VGVWGGGLRGGVRGGWGGGEGRGGKEEFRVRVLTRGWFVFVWSGSRGTA